MPGKVTLTDVAAAAGVSRSTASRAVNGTSTRSVPARLRTVKEVADRLGYVPDASAQAVARGRTSTVGLLLMSLATPAAEQLASGVSRAVRASGLAPLVMSAHEDQDTLVENVRAMHRLRARGVVVALPIDYGPADPYLVDALHAFATSGGSVCTVGAELPGVSAVVPDEVGGARSLATLVCGAGYRSVVLLGGPPDARIALERRNGVLEAFAAVGRPVAGDRVLTGPDTVEDGRIAARRALGDPAIRPQILVAVSERLASGVLLAVQDLGFSMPHDIAVAFLGTGLLSSQGVTLTAASPPFADMAKSAAEIVLTDGVKNFPRRVILPVIPFLGESTPPVTTAASLAEGNAL